MTWTRDNIKSELVALFGQHADVGAQITESSHLVADLGIDSLGVMEIVQELEDKFELRIPDEAIREVETVADVAHAVEEGLHADGRLAG